MNLINVVYFFSVKEISFTDFYSFLSSIDSKLIGYFDMDSLDHMIVDLATLEMIYDEKFTDDFQFLFRAIFISEFVREFDVSFIQNKASFEVRIYLDPFDEIEEEIFKSKIKNSVKDKCFEMIICDSNEESHKIEWNEKFESFLNLPKSVDYLSFLIDKKKNLR